MDSARPAEPQAPQPEPGSWGQRFANRHLQDYGPAARRAWFALAAGGLAAVLLAAAFVARRPLHDQLGIALGCLLVAMASFAPLRVPRTRYMISAADIFVFVLLGLHGWPAAVLAAAVEGAVGAWRGSQRLSSRVASPSSAALGLLAGGLCFEALRNGVDALTGSRELGTLLALVVAAGPSFACGTLLLVALMRLKAGAPGAGAGWVLAALRDYAWLGAIAVGSALLAGVLVLNALHFGLGVIAVAAVAAAALLALAHVSLQRHEAERAAQEAAVDAAREQAELNRQRFTAAFTHAALAMAIVHHDGRIRQVNRALARLVRREEPALVGSPFTALLLPADAPRFARLLGEMPAEPADEPHSAELRCTTPDGEELWVSMHCSRFTDPADARPALIFQLHDITSRRRAEDRLHHTAYHDSLTDLPNRHCFNEQLAQVVERSRGDGGPLFAVLFLDLDRFKVVNDSLGHGAGNVLLCEVARRLTAHVRPGDLVARLGGDEFAVLAEGIGSREQALALARRLLDALAAPVTINGNEVLAAASIGVTVGDLGYRSTDEILRDADLAMYAAKAEGRGSAMLFDQSMHERAAERLQLEGELRRAIGQGQLSLQFQPLYQLQPYRLAGFEALARWIHPERGPISPAVFIGLAEETGHIEALTQWIIDQAVAQVAEWQRAAPEAGYVEVHVNISARDLMRPDLPALVDATLRRHGVPAHALTLEITETSLMGRIETALESLAALRALGVRFSIDDFGTGYSSLAYLSRLPIDSLKIDRSFVIGMGRSKENLEIVRAVLDLGRSLGKKVIAEGIETPAQLHTLRELGVHVGQGYLLSRPLPPARAAELIGAPALLAP